MALRISKTDAFGCILLIVGYQIGLAVVNGVFSGVLLDTDAYMHLDRVIYLHQHGEWFASSYPRVNPPFGLEQHWTRPFDVLLWVGAFIGSPIFGFDRALHGWSVMLGPLLQIASLLAMLWAVLPVADTKKLEALGILFVGQAGIIASFMVGRPDHQVLIYFLAIVSIGFTVRLLLQPFKGAWCLGAGLVAALAIWVSMESLLFVCLSFVALGLVWLQGQPEAEKKLFFYALWCFFGVVIALLLEKGWAGFLTPRYDEISSIYVLVMGLNLLIWLLVYGLSRGLPSPLSKVQRFGLVLLGGVVSVAVILWVFPDFFRGPLQVVDPLYRRVRLARIQELQPLFPTPGVPLAAQVSQVVFWVGISLPALPVMVVQWVTNEAGQRPYWTFLSLGVLVFLPLAIEHVRWAPYVAIYALPGYAWLIARLVKGMEQRVTARLVPVWRVGIYAVSVCWLFVPNLVWPIQSDHGEAHASGACHMQGVSQILDDPQTWGKSPRRLLATTDYGPELLYRTPHTVYSIPNHRFQQGFTDTYHFFSTTDPEVAHKIVERTGVELILICPYSGEGGLYRRKDGKPNFYVALAEGHLPDWLRAVPLPEHLEQNARLFEVVQGIPADPGN